MLPGRTLRVASAPASRVRRGQAVETEALGPTGFTIHAHIETPVEPELLSLIAEVAATTTPAARRALIAILDEYINEWLYRLRPLPYIPNLAVEVASRKAWIPELVEKIGASTIAEAMGLALQAAQSGDCVSLLPRLVAVEEALIEASGIEPGEAIKTAMASSDCRVHAALIANLIAVKPWGGEEA